MNEKRYLREEHYVKLAPAFFALSDTIDAETYMQTMYGYRWDEKDVESMRTVAKVFFCTKCKKWQPIKRESRNEPNSCRDCE